MKTTIAKQTETHITKRFELVAGEAKAAVANYLSGTRQDPMPYTQREISIVSLAPNGALTVEISFATPKGCPRPVTLEALNKIIYKGYER